MMLCLCGVVGEVDMWTQRARCIRRTAVIFLCLPYPDSGVCQAPAASWRTHNHGLFFDQFLTESSSRRAVCSVPEQHCDTDDCLQAAVVCTPGSASTDISSQCAQNCCIVTGLWPNGIRLSVIHV